MSKKQNRLSNLLSDGKIKEVLESINNYSDVFEFDELKYEVVMIAGEFAEFTKDYLDKKLNREDALVWKAKIRNKVYYLIQKFYAEIEQHKDHLLFQFIFPAQDFVDKFTKRSRTLSKYIGLFVFDPNNIPMGNIDDVIDEAINLPEKNAIAILGDFGSGKSTFAKNYCFRKANEWLEQYDLRLPILIQLKDYDASISFLDWILWDIQNSTNVNLSKGDLLELIHKGKIILILDGLDEMSKKSDFHQQNIRDIERLTGKNSPVIITCRTTFFVTRFEQEFKLKKFYQIHLKEFDDNQISEFTRKYFKENNPSKDWINFTKLLRQDPYLNQLSKKPLFLDLMSKLFAKDEMLSIKNLHDLYSQFIDYYIARESERSKLKLSILQRKKIIIEIAWEMFNNDKNYFTYEDFDKLLKDNDNSLFGVTIEDLMLEGFFTKNRQGNFSFVHYSFVEFFVAIRLVNEIKQKKYINLSKRVFYEEIFEFIAHALESTKGFEIVAEIFKERSINQIIRVNIIPPIRKSVPVSLIPVLIESHFKDPSALVRYVCGYTLPIFFEKYPKYFRENNVLEKFMGLYKSANESNSLVTFRSEYLLSMIEFDQYPNYLMEIDDESITEIVSIPGTINAYEKILSINRENKFVIEESIHILTQYTIKINNDYEFKDDLIDLLSETFLQSNESNIKRVAKWAINNLKE